MRVVLGEFDVDAYLAAQPRTSSRRGSIRPAHHVEHGRSEGRQAFVGDQHDRLPFG